jgi:hypothetical protein
MYRARIESMELTRDILEILEGRWRACGAPIARHLRDGLDDDEMDAITLPLGLRLSREARTWWGWHDGVSLANEAARAVSNGFAFLPLAEAAQVCAVERWAARGAAVAASRSGHGHPLNDPESHWPRRWVPLLAIKFAYIVCDASVDPSPVSYRSQEEFELPGQPDVPSIGAMVQMWIESIDAGDVSVDPALGLWTHRTRANRLV